ncbi:prepilin-type N-terminal cleavage/methylation domain-containing protein, partial [Candidatus Gracilibacteria bacterium]|nr:prepilin-type N-terminal cleavage/methylation domain-containing protein [Candidatus Gracilibacteria bacterium]
MNQPKNTLQKPNKHLSTKKAFTLVELIIVITILSILAIISFMSFQSFSKDARDGNRLTTLKNIEKGLRLEYERNKKYPLPEGTTLVYTGNISQGYIKESISRIIGLNKEAKDPKNDTNYLYTINGTQDKFQVTGYLELKNEIIFASKIIPLIYAEDTNYKDRHIVTFGDRVGYLYDAITNAPLQENYQNFDEIDENQEVGILFSNNPKDQTNTIASGSNLGGKLALGQSACELDNEIILQGQTIQAYNTNTYNFGTPKPTPIARTCNNQVLSGDSNYKYIKTTEQQPQNCEATSYSGYT